ncbi:hypothetical protein C474_03995 [Halogeometricum pallidum JCM 14848]|uniref:Uncharacterized protein n=1 Tax=Halogeometricum pallidum JCM 14848 TaxID=1227487 RepID=M0DF68_HALPD|nr:DUF5809 family protein [Halogeometricum pallidum]ELZ34090.1 hypothetical protein C474_03995 [Halogeometricum pallidum JCM 14848]
METEGSFAPESEEEARAAFESAGPTARQVVREAAKAMSFDREEYRERVTSDVVETARNVLFADRLAVRVGTREEFETWTDEHPEYEVTEVGSPNVERVVWHAAPFSKEAVAATYQNEREAAVGTLRRQAFSRLYRPRFESEEENTETEAGDDTESGAEDGVGEADEEIGPGS